MGQGTVRCSRAHWGVVAHLWEQGVLPEAKQHEERLVPGAKRGEEVLVVLRAHLDGVRDDTRRPLLRH